MATGAQRQHFSVLSALGVTMGYTSIISQGKELKKARKGDVDVNTGSEGSCSGSDEEEEAQERAEKEVGTARRVMALKPKRKRTPGVLVQLSTTCRETAREVASSRVFATTYDNINLMFRVAEQILGRQSKCFNAYPATHL